jgi:putative oxidoreductase
MNRVEQCIGFCEERREIWFELIRIYLGVALFVRGLFFFLPGGREALHGFLGTMAADGWFSAIFWGHFVIMAHLAGGLLLAIGLLTRVAAAVQIPVLFGAVFFVHVHEGLFALGQSLELASLVLFLLLMVFLRGPGVWSLDHYLLHRTLGISEHPHRV